jgi:hypothetical protein
VEDLVFYVRLGAQGGGVDLGDVLGLARWVVQSKFPSRTGSKWAVWGRMAGWQASPSKEKLDPSP